MWVRSLGLEDPLEEGMATHSSVLAWRIPWTEKPGGYSPGVTESDMNWSDLVHTHAWLSVLPWCLRSKESACSARDAVSIPGLGRSSGERNDNPLQYSRLENPMDREAWQAIVHGVQKSCCSVAQLCQLCDPMDCSTPGFPVLHHLPELVQTHVHWVSDAIQPSHPLLSPSPPAFNPSQHRGLF